MGKDDRAWAMLKKGLVALLLLGLFPGAGVASGAVGIQDQELTAAEEAADTAAREWLALIDEGNVGESWQQGATLFKEQVTREQWEQAVRQARASFENIRERTLLDATYTTELPNAPDGEYVVLQYRTQVAADVTVTETVVPMLEDGEWKVSGYFVRPDGQAPR